MTWAIAAGTAAAESGDALLLDPVAAPEFATLSDTVVGARDGLVSADPHLPVPIAVDLLTTERALSPKFLMATALVESPAGALLQLSRNSSPQHTDALAAERFVAAGKLEQRSPQQDPEVVTSARHRSPRPSEHPVVPSSRTTSGTDETPLGADDAPGHDPASVPLAVPYSPAGQLVGSSGALLFCDTAGASPVAGTDFCTVVRAGDAGSPVATGTQPGNAPD